MSTKSLFFLITILSSISLCAKVQVDYSNLINKSVEWTVEKAESIVDSIIPTLFEYQQRNVQELYEPAKVKYNAILIFHAEVVISKDQGQTSVLLLLEDSEMPFDLYFIHNGKTKVVIPSYKGKFEYADFQYSAPFNRMGIKTNRALRRILKHKPELIFIWEVYPFHYMYISKGKVYFQDSFTRKKYPLESCIELLETFLNKYNEVEEAFGLHQ